MRTTPGRILPTASAFPPPLIHREISGPGQQLVCRQLSICRRRCCAHLWKVSMNQNLLYTICSLAGAIPYFVIVALLIYYVIRRVRRGHAVRRGSVRGFYPSSAALGVVFLLTSMLFRPRLQHAIEARDVLRAEEDDGDPDSPGKLDKQLKRLRRGEPIETLILRM